MTDFHMFVKPALATSFSGALPPGQWVAEEKFDGHRILTCVAPDGGMLVWSRLGNQRILPLHIAQELQKLPCGTYDGELLAPGLRSYGTADLSNASSLRYMLFDLLSLDGQDITDDPYTHRSTMLQSVLSQFPELKAVQLSPHWRVETEEEVFDLANDIWNRDGEGLILKELSSTYRIGKRLKHWLKVKQLHSVEATLIGYSPGLMGDRSVAVLRDDSGTAIAVKWKDHAWLKEVAEHGDELIGRRVLIDYHERTPDGLYRHPRWDRWVEATE